MASIYDKISQRLAPAIRKYQDVTLLFGGTQTQIMRISKSTLNALPGGDFDAFGHANDTPTGEVMDDVGILYPQGMLEIFMDINNGQARITSYDLIELLPIQMIMRFNGEQSAKSVDLQAGDLIVDVMRDENGNKIPIVMEVTKTYGQFFVKDIVAKKCDLVMRWAQLETSIQTAIDNYIVSIT